MKNEDKNRLSISYDRTSVTIRLYENDSFQYYKDCRKSKASFVDCDFVSMPIGLVTPDGYYYSVRGKVSLKEYISGEETVSPEMFSALSKSIAEIIIRAGKYQINLGDVLFDYNCVFLQGTCENFTFLYMPGAATCENTASPKDLLSVVFLNTEAMIFGERYEELKGAVQMATESLKTDEFTDGLMNIVSLVNLIIEERQSFARKLKKRLAANRQVKKTECRETITQENEKIVAFILEKDGSKRNVFEKNVGEGALIKVGRDPDWSDILIDSIFVSRRHAEITLNGEGFFVHDMSLNGTFIDNVKIVENKSYDLIPDGARINIGKDYDIELIIEKRTA